MRLTDGLLAILLCICGFAYGEVHTFAWDGSPAESSIYGITYEIEANGVLQSEIVGHSVTLDIPVGLDRAIEARVRAVPPINTPPGCGDSPAEPCRTVSSWATLSSVIPDAPSNVYITKQPSTGTPVMAAPTFVAQYATAFNNVTTPKTAMSAVSINSGDVLVALAANESGDGNQYLSLTENGSAAFANTISLPQYLYSPIYAQTYSAIANETLTVTVANSLSGYFGANVVRFSGSDGIGASVSGSGSGTAAQLSITTTQANSAIVVIFTDWNALTESQTFTSNGGAGTPTALTGYAGDGVRYGAGIAYYPDAGAVGAKTVGMSAPSGQKWQGVAFEVKGTASGGATGSAALRGGARTAAVGNKGKSSTAVFRDGGRTTAVGNKGALGGVVSRDGGRTAVSGSAAASATGSALSHAGGRSLAVGAKGISGSAASRDGGKTAVVGAVSGGLTKPIARWAGSVAAATDITSSSISVNAGDLLVLCVSAETYWTGAEKDLTMAVSGGGTWTTDKDQDNGTDGGHASIHHLVCPSTTSFQIGVQYLTGIGGPYQLSAQVYKLSAGSFDATTPIGATGGGTGTTSPLNPTLYTSTVNNSRAVYCGTEYFINGAVSSSDTYDSAVYTGSIAALSAYKESVTPTAGTAVAGNLVAAASCYWTWAAVEVRPAGAPTGSTGTASSRDGGLSAASGSKSISSTVASRGGARSVATGGSAASITGSAASRGGARTSETSFAGLGSIDVGWNAVSGAAGYRVKWGLSSGVYTSGSIDVPSLQLQCVVGHLTPGVTYYLTCVALDGGGVEGDTATELSGTPDLIQAERDPCVVKCGGRTTAVGAKGKLSTVASRVGARMAAVGSSSISPVGVAASRGGGRSAAAGAKGAVSSVSPRDGGKLAVVGAKGVSSSAASRDGGSSTVTGSSSAALAGIAASRGGGRSATSGAKGAISAIASRDGGRSAAVGSGSPMGTAAARSGGRSVAIGTKGALGAVASRDGGRSAAIGSGAPMGSATTIAGGRAQAFGVKGAVGAIASRAGGRSAAAGVRVATGSAACRGGARMYASIGYIPYVMPLAAARRKWDNLQYVSRPRNVQS